MKPRPEPSTQEVLAGLVERVTYHNTENGFCVLRAKARGHRDTQVIARPTVQLTHLSVLRAITRKPSCLISCTQCSPEGGCGADVGRHGAMKPGGRVRGRKDMAG